MTPGRYPERLAEKLLVIRTGLGLSQRALIRRLGMEDELAQAEISMFESGRRVPSMMVVFRMAQLAGVWTDVLLDDAVDLPAALPADPKSAGVRRATVKRRATKTVAPKR